MVFSNLRSPISVQYELTNACNNNCLYCYNFWRNSNNFFSINDLNRSEAEQVIRKVGEAEVFDFLFTGGEPLLKKSLLFHLIPIVKKYHMSISINSNLRLCTLEDAIKMKDLGVNSIISSLPSYNVKTTDMITRSEGSFYETTKGIKNALKAGHKIAVNMVVTKLNKNHVYDTGRFLYEVFGVERFMATPMSPSFSSEYLSLELNKSEIVSTLDDLVRLEEDIGISTDVLEPIPYCLINNPKYYKFMLRSCNAGATTLTIGSNGDIRPCSHSQQIYGNILKQDLKKVWDNMQEWRNGEIIPSKCKGCAEVVKCGGGCRVNARIKTGKLNGEDPWMENSLEKRIEKKIKVDKLDLDKKYKVSNMIRIRAEDGEKYCMSPRPGIMIVGDENLFWLVKILVKEEKIIPKEISKKYNLDEEYLYPLLNMLYINKFLE